MDPSLDFPSRAHHLQRWYTKTTSFSKQLLLSSNFQILHYHRFGLRDFLILAPLSDKGCDESEANMLLSTLSVVIQDTEWYCLAQPKKSRREKREYKEDSVLLTIIHIFATARCQLLFQ